MPLYDYQCPVCEHEFETLQGINDEPLAVCPECGASELRKKVSAPAFTFKGGGWYKDLYGSSGGTKANSDSSTAPSGGDAAKSSGDSGGSSSSSTTKSDSSAKAG
ncbi:FmdB family zinc ribbon protein [Acanthopleuribacter pedis]|uniref:Zinc ribbon domain-containing protein n=1 Tax=Acanthopleuribacter pedis TaxID=442870 RepID=A0A8J7U8Y3_9BACT|nr:zinc ribbon domain-containing protein [Acanthopleuribacter pedis]MBO1323076.1 zinc ribbon domain-containing protein [Acanthopleuribacter pedis]